MTTDERFTALMTDAMVGADRFGHRQHVRLAWLAVRGYGQAEAETLVCQGIRSTARYAGAPQKYHLTQTMAWLALVGHHATDRPDLADFDEFLAQHPDLLDKRLLARHYRSTTLAASTARTTWVEPDLHPFPWRR